MEPIVKIETLWKKELPSGSPCAVCSEHIFSDSYKLYILINEKVIDAETEVCYSCYDLIKKDGL